MSKQKEALKLALEGLEKWRFDKDPRGADEYITAIREALAEQGCDYCNHPQYAGTKCKNCGREQPAQQQYQSTADKCELTPVPAKGGLPPAQQDIPKIGCVNHDCDKCKARQQQEHVSLMTVLHLKDRTEIGYGPASAGYDLPTGEYKLYTSPPASKPWVGLTDEEIDECYYWKDRQWTTDELVRHVEAKLREKNA